MSEKKKTSAFTWLVLLVIIAAVVYHVNTPAKTDKDRENEKAFAEARRNADKAILEGQANFLRGLGYFTSVEADSTEIRARLADTSKIENARTSADTAAVLASKELDKAGKPSSMMVWVVSDANPDKAYYWVSARHGRVNGRSGGQK